MKGANERNRGLKLLSHLAFFSSFVAKNSVEGALKEVKRALLDADVNLKVTNRLVEGVKSKAVGMKLVDGE